MHCVEEWICLKGFRLATSYPGFDIARMLGPSRWIVFARTVSSRISKANTCSISSLNFVGTQRFR